MLTALLLAGCPGDPNACGEVTDPDASAASLVDDPLVGVHTGTLTWLETMKETSVVLSVTATGPVSQAVEEPGSDPCPSGHQISLDVSIESSDGLIPPTQEKDLDVWVAADGGVEIDSLNVGLDAAPILAGGAAPEEPDLASMNPQTTLLLARGSSPASLTGTLRVTSPETSVTLATIAF